MKLLCRRVRAAVLVGTLAPFLAPGGSRAASPPQAHGTRPDSAQLVAQAHRDQGDFERRHLMLVPVAATGSDDSCDDRIGRFCFWYQNDWSPPPEPATLALLRDRLIAQLDRIAVRVPGDDWVLGQRVWYRAAAGRWRDALRVARACGGAKPWWCAALEGFALHGMGRYEAAGRAFARALTLMDSTRARAWRIPARTLDPQEREYLQRAPPDSLAPRLARLWMLADPLYLVPGNDRETAYYARRTVARIRRDAVTPYELSWGPDLDALLIRYGWEVGWQRAPANAFLGGFPHAVGQEAEQGRTFMPSDEALTDPSAAGPHELEADLDRPRSLYTPAYAPVLLPIHPPVAFFSHGDSFTVVATTYLPADTTRFRGKAVPNPMHEAAGLASEPDQAGLFLMPLSGGAPKSSTRSGSTSGVFLLRAPAGRYVLSAESWSPRQRRAGRYRVGVVEDSTPTDVAALSDLLLMRSSGSEPRTLKAALPLVLRAPVVTQGENFAVGWELTGLGGRSELVTYRLTVHRTNESLLRRVRGWLHLGGAPRRPLSLSWREQAPAPGRSARFHRLVLHVPELAPGRWEVRLEAHVPGRSALVSVRRFDVRPAKPGTREPRHR